MKNKQALILAALIGPHAFGIPIITPPVEDVQVITISVPATGGIATIKNVPIDGTAFPLVPPRPISRYGTTVPQPVPETVSTAALLGLGVVSSALLRRRLS